MEREFDRDGVAFEADGFGSLQDILVLDTDAADWQRLLDFLRADALRLDFSIDGIPADLPITAAQIFPVWRQAAPALLVDFQGVRLGCYFFDPSETELDFDPRDVTSDEQRTALLAFMRTLSDLLDKPVVLAPEGSHDEVLIRFEPVSQTVG